MFASELRIQVISRFNGFEFFPEPANRMTTDAGYAPWHTYPRPVPESRVAMPPGTVKTDHDPITLQERCLV